jgi:hypothetical protein
MDERSNVAVVMTFRISPGTSQYWQDTWIALREVALRSSGCTRFEVSPPARPGRDGEITSTWRSREDFNRFVRDSGVLWIDRVRWSVCARPYRVTVSPEKVEERAALCAVR